MNKLTEKNAGEYFKKGIFFLVVDNNSFKRLVKRADGSKAMNELLNILGKKMFTSKHTGMTYRQINHASEKILKDERNNKAKWKRFNMKELIYLAIVKELRKYRFTDKEIQPLRKIFFSKKYEEKIGMVTCSVIDGTKVHLVFHNGSVGFYNAQMFSKFVDGMLDLKSYLNINLNMLISKVFQRVGAKKRLEYSAFYDIATVLDEKEKQIIEIIRNREYRKITITKNKQAFVVSGEKTKGTERKTLKGDDVLKLIQDGDYSDCKVATRDGKIVNVTKEDKFKI